MPRSSLPRPVAAPAPWAASAWSRLKKLFGARGAGGAPSANAGPWPALGGVAGRRLPQASDYALQHVIARNDRATIYQALEQSSGRMVALKTVRIGSGAGDRGLWRERFLREAAAAARLKHEHIVRVHAGGVQGEGDALTGWLAMEWVHGTDLSRYATPARLLPEGVVLGIALRVAIALDVAHQAGVVHRDVKPSNVLFDPTTGTVKVTDFGSARVADTAATRSGLILGTPAYMAPEQLAGAEVAAQSDLYGLGVMLFELLTGRRPFEAESMGELLRLIAHQTPPRLRTLRPELPALLDDIVARLLAKTPAMRQATAREVAVELKLAQAGCLAAAPGSAAAAWADTAPGEDPDADHPKVGTVNPAFQGTIAE